MEKKLAEETSEYLESRSVEELVDILEVVYRISELKGTSRSELESFRKRKLLEKGGFSKNLFLIETQDD